MSTPYRVEGPALISVSGGRTSAFMLRQIIDAHGGKLPDDVIPVFCNTGREHEATLKFLHEIETRWCPIVWLEYDVADGQAVAKRVDFTTASRRGEPFRKLIDKEGALPNVMMRFCTKQLKIRTMARWARGMGWKDWDEAVGLRYDEPRRVHAEHRDGVLLPMADAKHGLDDVLAFWSAQDFDLELPSGDPVFGNCVGCFLKGRGKLERAMLEQPEHFEQWADDEERTGYRYHKDRPAYRVMMAQVTVQGRLWTNEDDTLPCRCTD